MEISETKAEFNPLPEDAIRSQNFDKEVFPGFNERELEEIQFSLEYTNFFNHGTAGHLAYTVIAKLATLLIQKENE